MNNELYNISEKALDDLDEIWVYTFENWSLEQADTYYNLIISEIEYLAGNYSLGKAIDYIKKGYWVSKIKSHLIFYTLGAGNKINIIRILHQQMDIENRLND